MDKKVFLNDSRALYDVRHIANFRDLVDSCAEKFPNEPAFKLKDSSGTYYTVSYTAWKDDVYALGAAMYEMGIKGTKVAVMGMNSYNWLLTYLATTIGSNVIVPVDKELMFDDINTIVTVSESSYLFADTKSLKKLEEKKENLPANLKIVILDSVEDRDGYLGFGKVLEMGKKLVADNATAYVDFCNNEIDPDVCAVISFTSATSGIAKGVMLSQTNICFVVMANSSVADVHPGDQLLSVLPIHHTFECSLGILAQLYNGCCIAFAEGLLQLVKNMQEIQPTVFFTVPLMLEKIHGRIMKAVSEKKGGKLKLSFGKVLASATNMVGVDMNDKIFAEITKNFGGKLRLIIIGAAAVRPDVIKDFKTFGIPAYIGYGLTECAPLVSCNHDQLWAPDTVGRAIPGVEVKVINADANGVGEVCVKGPNVMLGYYMAEEETKAVIDEYGWFHTGDLGTMDDDGIIRLTGRIKNVIVTKNGKNIYPEEIEYHLNKNPLIAESMVVGFDTDDGEETLVEAKIFPDMAAIKEKYKGKDAPTNEEITKMMTDIIKDINKKLPNYKNIKKINIRETEFIKTTTSKIKRYANMDNDGGTEKML